MKLNEKHHAAMVLAFYQELKETFGETGLEAFSKAEQLYGEQRGRRMALRSLRDGNGLSFTEYFAYSEWETTPGFFEVEMTASAGMVNECVTRCPWAEVFRAAGFPECGERYCADIDRAIVRGFNPALRLDLLSTQHREKSCRFHFLDERITSDIFAEGDALLTHTHTETILPFEYHCAHVYRVFCDTVADVFGAQGKALIERVCQKMRDSYGDALLETLEIYNRIDFNRLPARQEY